MKKIYILSFILFPFICFSQTDSTSKQLDEVTITATMQTDEIRQVARNITVITAKQIEQAPVKTIDGILQYALNVDVRTRSPFGVQSDISIRGGNFDQTLVLVDGVKMNDPQTGHHTLNLPIPISQIEKIEVLQGGASRIFGPAAFSGVINIITKKVTKNEGTFTGVIGKYLLRGYQANYNFIKNNFTSQAAFEHLASEGYSEKTDFMKYTGLLQASFHAHKNTLNLKGGWYSNKFGAANFYHPAFTSQYEEVASVFAIVQDTYNHSNKVQSTFVGSYRNHSDFFDLNNYRYVTIENLNIHKTNVLDFSWKTLIRSKLGKTTLGAEYRIESVLSNRLGYPSEKSILTKLSPNLFLDKFFSRNNASLYVEQQYNHNALKIVGGTLVNINSQFGTKLYPGIDASYAISEPLSVYGSINRSLRFPTFTELFLNTATLIADVNLLPESAWSYEVGLKRFTNQFQSTFSVFYRDTENAIDKVLYQNEKTPKMVNIDNINFFGFEFGSTFLPKEQTKLSKIFRNFTLNYSYLHADKNEIGYQSFYTLNYLTHKFNASFSTTTFKRFSLSAYYTFKKRQGSYQLNASSPPNLYQPIHLLDAKLRFTKKWAILALEANNILNLEYYEFGFVKLPKRWISASMTIRF